MSHWVNLMLFTNYQSSAWCLQTGHFDWVKVQNPKCIKFKMEIQTEKQQIFTFERLNSLNVHTLFDKWQSLKDQNWSQSLSIDWLNQSTTPSSTSWVFRLNYDKTFYNNNTFGMTCQQPVAWVQEDLGNALSQKTDLITHHHGSSSISIIEAAPSTAGRSASSKCRAWTISAWSLSTHAHRSSAQPRITAGERFKTKTLAFTSWGYNGQVNELLGQKQFYTVYLPCWSLYRHHSSIHALHPWVSGCATCQALSLWHP